MLDLTQIARCTLNREPYSWAAINGLLAPKPAAALAATFPLDHFKTVSDRESAGEARALLRLGEDAVAHSMDLTHVWRELAHELLSPAYRTAISLLPGCDLTPLPTQTTPPPPRP